MRAAPSGRLRIGPALVGLAVASRSDLRHEAESEAEISAALLRTRDEIQAMLNGD